MKPYQKQGILAGLEKFGKVDLVVEGNSMWPAIKSGEKVTLRQQFSQLKAGQIIAYFLDDQLITHRIVWSRKTDKETRIWVRGDLYPIRPQHLRRCDIVAEVFLEAPGFFSWLYALPGLKIMAFAMSFLATVAFKLKLLILKR